MSRIGNYLHTALKNLPEKPSDNVRSTDKKRYSELMSAELASALAQELRARGMKEALPSVPGEASESGAERRISGGLGAKKVDVTWATEVSGLLFAASVKTINFRDRGTGNFQKNLTNRRGDILVEAATLHRRFPYAVLMGFFFFDVGAQSDDTPRRRSTFDNAHQRFRLFSGRLDPAGREEQFERFYVGLVDANRFSPQIEVYEAGKSEPVSFEDVFNDIVALVAERNPDFYEADGEGSLRRLA